MYVYNIRSGALTPPKTSLPTPAPNLLIEAIRRLSAELNLVGGSVRRPWAHSGLYAPKNLGWQLSAEISAVCVYIYIYIYIY